jgi:hypothetical protein
MVLLDVRQDRPVGTSDSTAPQTYVRPLKLLQPYEQLSAPQSSINVAIHRIRLGSHGI